MGTPIREYMTKNPVTMAEHKFGSVVVVEGGKIVGMFTTVDGMRALADVLNGRAHS